MSLGNLPQKSFCLIRHGETTANRDQIIAGRWDVALTETGRQQAETLRQLEWSSPLALFASPMARAVESCRLGFPGQSFEIHPDLRERDWGAFEGKPLAQLPPREGCPERGEDWSDMIRRVAGAVTDCCLAAQTDLPVILCHSGVIRAVRLLSGQTTTGTRPDNASPVHFYWTDHGHKELSHAANLNLGNSVHPLCGL